MYVDDVSYLFLCFLIYAIYAAVEETQQEESSEFFVRADFNLPFNSTDATLLYFLKLSLIDLDIAFGEITVHIISNVHSHSAMIHFSVATSSLFLST